MIIQEFHASRHLTKLMDYSISRVITTKLELSYYLTLAPIVIEHKFLSCKSNILIITAKHHCMCLIIHFNHILGTFLIGTCSLLSRYLDQEEDSEVTFSVFASSCHLLLPV